MGLSQLIIQARGSVKPSQFAKSLGVSRQCVYQWENDLREPSLEMLEKIGIERQFVLQEKGESNDLPVRPGYSVNSSDRPHRVPSKPKTKLKPVIPAVDLKPNYGNNIVD